MPFPRILPLSAAPSPIGDGPEPIIPFTAVPRQRHRRNGWTEARQREFIAYLARCGSVQASARAVGMTPRSVYRLLDAPGADEFARAWDTAIDLGMARLRCDAVNRALVGDYVPVYRKGRLVRVEHRRSDRLAIAILSGKNNDVDTFRRLATSRREMKAGWDAYDATVAAEEQERAAWWDNYQKQRTAMLERAKTRPEPHIRRL